MILTEYLLQINIRLNFFHPDRMKKIKEDR